MLVTPVFEPVMHAITMSVVQILPKALLCSTTKNVKYAPLTLYKRSKAHGEQPALMLSFLFSMFT